MRNLLLTATVILLSSPAFGWNADKSQVDFGTVKAGAKAYAGITLTNDSSSQEVISSVSVSGQAVRVEKEVSVDSDGKINEEEPLPVGAGESAAITLSCYSTTPGTYTGEVVFSTTDGEVRIPYTCTVSENTPTASPSSVDFGQVSNRSELSVKLNTTAPLSVSSVSLSGGEGALRLEGIYYGTGEELQASPEFPVSVSPEDDLVAVVSCGGNSDASSGVYQGELIFSTSAGAVKVPITCDYQPQLSLSLPSAVEFGTVKTGVQKVLVATLVNSSSVSQTISKVEVSGQGYSLLSEGIEGKTLQPGESLPLILSFKAPEEGDYSGTLTVYSSQSQASSTLHATASNDVNLSLPSEVDFGKAKVGEEVKKTISLKNTGETPLQILSVDVNLPFFVSSNLPAETVNGRPVELELSFVPTQNKAVYTSSLVIHTDRGDFTLNLKGESYSPGIEGVSIYFKDKSVSSLNLGKVNRGQNFSITLENPSDQNLEVEVSYPSFLDGNSSITIPAGGKAQLSFWVKGGKGKVKGRISLSTSRGALLLPVEADVGKIGLYFEPVSWREYSSAPSGYRALDGVKFTTLADNGGNAVLSMKIDLPQGGKVFKLSRTGWKDITPLVSGGILNLTVKDNSDFDLDDRIGVIEDPIVVAQPVSSGSGTEAEGIGVSSGGGGCSASGGSSVFLSLLGLAPLLFLRRKNGKGLYYCFNSSNPNKGEDK